MVDSERLADDQGSITNQRPELWQEINRAWFSQACRTISSVDGCTPNSSASQAVDAILVIRNWLLPEEKEPPVGEGEPWPMSYQQMSDAKWEQRQVLRAMLTAEAEKAAITMSKPNHFDLQSLPAWPQSQESLSNQLGFLVQVANRLGLYDAADAVKQLEPRIDEIRYGCHVDIDCGCEPDGCVIDEGRLHDCIYAKEGMRKEQCKYWQIVVPNKKTEVG